MSATRPTVRRARRWFWALLLVAIGAMGGLFGALGAAPGPGAGLAVALTSLLLLVSTAQAARILLALERARRPLDPDRAAGQPEATAPAATVRSARDRILGPTASHSRRPRGPESKNR